VAATARKPLYTHLYFQVVCAILIGILLGHFYPALAVKMQPLGEAFIKAIKMLIAPIIFCTVVHGIASMNDMKKVGRVGLKAIVYFEVVTTLALIVGLIIVNLWQPGAGINVDPSAIDTKSIQSYATQAKSQNTVDYLLHIIPATVVGAFSEGEILQVLFISILFAFALHMAGERGKPVLSVIESAAQVFFGIVGIVMRAAPLGAFGAMAFTIGKYGIGSLASLAELMAAFYTTCLIFVFGVLGTIARLTGFSILRFIRCIKEELLIVLGTSSSEAVLPRMIAKMEILGCDESVVGLVIPTGYSFNLDGTNIYMTLATLFIAQALGVDLTFGQQLTIVAVAMLTSKGASGVTGAGFITLAATLSVINPALVPGMAIVFSVDKFMSEVRALTNIIGNGIAAVFVSWWEGELDHAKLHARLNQEIDPSDVETAVTTG